MEKCLWLPPSSSMAWAHDWAPSKAPNSETNRVLGFRLWRHVQGQLSPTAEPAPMCTACRCLSSHPLCAAKLPVLVPSPSPAPSAWNHFSRSVKSVFIALPQHHQPARRFHKQKRAAGVKAMKEAGLDPKDKRRVLRTDDLAQALQEVGCAGGACI